MDLAQDAHFPLEAAAVIGIEIGGHHLDGDGTRAVGFIGGLPHLTHATLADTDREAISMIE